MTIETFLQRLRGVTCTSNGYKALCPGHEDQHPSLDIAVGDDGRILLHCKAQCPVARIVEALGLTLKDLFPANRPTRMETTTYDYKDADGKVVYQKVKTRFPNGDKTFFVQRPKHRGTGWIKGMKGVERILYRLHDLPMQGRIYLAEGEKDADRLWQAQLPATTNVFGGGEWSADYTAQLLGRDPTAIVILEDNDDVGRQRSKDLTTALHPTGIPLHVVALPDLPPHGDVSDWLAAGHPIAEFLSICDATPVYAPPRPQPTSLGHLRAACTRWFGRDYDFDAMTAVVATAAANTLGGDPLWFLLVSGSGATKTETVSTLTGVGAIMTGTISSKGALLSGSSKKDQAQGATGGLLRQVGDRGILVIKDVTSILSMNTNLRNDVLAALREIHDGYWVRDVGVDGGKRLEWRGQLAVIGAVTTAWDKHHEVIATMGDRFVLLRVDSNVGREDAGYHALANIGHETEMRHELAALVAGVIAGMNHDIGLLTDEENRRLFAAADLVTKGRTAVDHDWHGEVINSHAPEYPTRFLKQLAQLMRGAMAIGVARPDAFRLALRCARDSMPPMRLMVLQDIAANPGAEIRDIWRRIDKPRKTVQRQVDALHQLGLLTLREEQHADVDAEGNNQPGKSTWHYDLASGVDLWVLDDTRPLFIEVGNLSGVPTWT